MSDSSHAAFAGADSNNAQRYRRSPSLKTTQPAQRNCCITGAPIWGPGTIQGQIGTFEIPPGEVLREGSFPELRERSEVPISPPPQRELPLSNPMGKLDSGQRNRCTPERLEASHRGASAFDR